MAQSCVEAIVDACSWEQRGRGDLPAPPPHRNVTITRSEGLRGLRGGPGATGSASKVPVV